MKRIIIPLCLLASTALAQLATGPNPEAVAQRAVETWLGQGSLNLNALLSRPLPEACEELAATATAAPPPAGTRVNLEDRRELESLEAGLETGDEARLYSYPASVGEALGTVRVTLTREGDAWVTQSVRLQLGGLSPGLPAVFQQPIAGWAFIAFSLLLTYLLARPSFLRRWLAQGWRTLREFRGIVIGTIVLLYGVFALGMLTGANLPAACTEAITTIVSQGVESTGAVEAYASGDVARAAAATAAWNFSMGAISTTLVPATLLAVPAYLLNVARFFVTAIPFGGLFSPLLLFHLPVIIVELMAYVLITAGGGIMLALLFRRGFAGLSEGFRKLLLMVPIALVLLVIGAWYEAFELIVLFGGVG